MSMIFREGIFPIQSGLFSDDSACFINGHLDGEPQQLHWFGQVFGYTLPETNITKNGWLEYYFPVGKAYFQGLC